MHFGYYRPVDRKRLMGVPMNRHAYAENVTSIALHADIIRYIIAKTFYLTTGTVHTWIIL